MHFRKSRREYFYNILGSDNCEVNYFFVFNMCRFFFELANFFRVLRVQKRIIVLGFFNPKLRLIAFRCIYVKIYGILENEFYFFMIFLRFEFHNKSFVIPFYIFGIERSARVVYFIFLKSFHVATSSSLIF